MIRHYLLVIQDHRGYSADGDPLESAPPEGPYPPRLHSVVMVEDHEAEVKRLTEAVRNYLYDHGSVKRLLEAFNV